jgi:hypothetical protein
MKRPLLNSEASLASAGFREHLRPNFAWLHAFLIQHLNIDKEKRAAGRSLDEVLEADFWGVREIHLSD